ncbi:hypothetical protein ACA910_019133 [Epithemia clementina (nom. ined.)]
MGGSTKRMSTEEKRKVILEIYHTSKSVYTEKEILALAAKAGINASTVGDIHTSLVDDGLVDKEKIGGSNYFWSFPSKQDRQAQLEHQRVLKEIEQLKKDMEQAQVDLASAKRGREDEEEDDNNDNSNNNEDEGGNGDGENGTTTKTDNEGNNTKPIVGGGRRSQKLARLELLAKERVALETELAALKENDPQALADLQQELVFVTQAANRWTDNIFNCQTYLVKKRGMNKKEVNRMLGITDSFDYPEDKVPK